MNILIPPIVNMPRVCDECPEDLCLIGYTPPCPSQCYDFDFTCEPIYNSYECSGTFTFRHIYHELTQLYEQGHCDSFGNSLHRVAMLLLFMILIGDKNVLLFNE